jgi:large subunit ribosomal protein L25
MRFVLQLAGRAEYHNSTKMKTFDLVGSKRAAIGKKDAKQLRSEEKVPCVLYGKDETIHFSTVARDLKDLVYTPNVYIVNLTIDGKVYAALMQDIQFHPVTDEVLHIDFMQIYEDKPVKVDIPVNVTGFAKGIKKGGKLQVEVRRLKIQALPKDLPNTIDIDVTELDLNQSLRVSDLDSTKVTYLNGKSVPVVRIMMTRAARAAAQAKDTPSKKK